MDKVGKTWRAVGTIAAVVGVLADLYGGNEHGSFTYSVATVLYVLSATGFLISALYERMSRVYRLITYATAVLLYGVVIIRLLVTL